MRCDPAPYLPSISTTLCPLFNASSGKNVLLQTFGLSTPWECMKNSTLFTSWWVHQTNNHTANSDILQIQNGLWWSDESQHAHSAHMSVSSELPGLIQAAVTQRWITMPHTNILSMIILRMHQVTHSLLLHLPQHVNYHRGCFMDTSHHPCPILFVSSKDNLRKNKDDNMPKNFGKHPVLSTGKPTRAMSTYCKTSNMTTLSLTITKCALWVSPYNTQQ